MQPATDIHARRDPLATVRGVPTVAGHLRRDGRGAGRATSALRGVRPLARGDRARRVHVALGGGQAQHSRERRHLQRLWRSPGRRSALGARHGAAAHLARGMGRSRDGARSADATAQSDPGRPLRPSDPARLRPAAALPRLLEPGVPAGVSRHSRSAWDSPASACGRPGALARRSMVGARRPHASAIGSRVCARKPDRAAAQPARSVPRLSGSPAGVVLQRSARHAAGDGAAAARPAQGRAADAGAVQRNVLRARVSRALSRLHPGRRRRLDGAGSPGLHQDARRPAAGRRRLPQARRQLLRPARAAQRFVARRRGPGRGGTGRQRHDRQRARLGRDRDGSHHAVPTGAVPAPARRGAETALVRHLVGRTTERARVRDRSSRPARREAGVSDRRARAGLRQQAERGRESAARGRAAGAAGPLRRAGVRRTLGGAGLAPGPDGASARSC